MAILRIALYNLLAVRDRLGTSLVIVVGVACVVGVFVASRMVSFGLTTSVQDLSRADWAIVTAQGAVMESMSTLSLEQVQILATHPVLKDHRQVPGFVTSLSRQRQTGLLSALLVRGLSVADTETDIQPQFADGRIYQAGQHELIVGDMAARSFSNLEVGDVVSLYGIQSRIVGRFQSTGLSADSELVGDIQTLMSAAQRSSISSVRIAAEGIELNDELRGSVNQDRRVKVDITPEVEFFKLQGSAILLQAVATVVAAIMAMGAVFGGINVMYTAVDARVLEIAILRSMGFGGMAIVCSILLEALVLALCGGVLGIGVTALFLHGETYASGSMTTLVAPLTLTPAIAGWSLCFAGGIGLLAGLFPALRAVRQSVAVGLRWEG